MTNLLEGDEYGEGFQLFKYIEENHGGVKAVKEFLRTGNISFATNNEIVNIANLYNICGISFDHKHIS